MTDIVTFDPVLKHIIEIDTGGDSLLDVREMYSEWKVWSRQNPQYLPAMSVVGGDELTPELDLGSTFFLENGWRFRPAERNHRVTLKGNLWTREPGADPSVDTIGIFRVTVQQQVSNLVDAAVARLDLDQLLQGIYLDFENGVAGTERTMGTPTNPVNNIEDAFNLAIAKNLRTFKMRNTHLQLNRNVHGWAFIGEGVHHQAGVHIEGFDVDRCLFERVHVDGWISGEVEMNNCFIGVIEGIHGEFNGCGLFTSFTLQENSSSQFINCHSEVTTGMASCIFRENSTIQLRNFSGELELFGMTNGCIAIVDLDPGCLHISESCTGGIVLVRGVGTLHDHSGLVTVDKTGLVGPLDQSIADNVEVIVGKVNLL
jgi:hypothetical protein